MFSENVFNFVKIYIKRIVTTEDRHDGVKHYVKYNSFLIKNVKLKTEILKDIFSWSFTFI